MAVPPFPRRTTPTVHVGSVPVGSDHPVVIQSMTNTDTSDVSATVEQVAALHRAGSEIVRVTVNDEAAARAVPEVKRVLSEHGIDVPLVGDFHYNGHLLLTRVPAAAAALDKYRINPGNVGVGARHDENFRRIVEIARDHGKPVRIGVNWGSLDAALLTRMMDENARSPEPADAHEVTVRAMVESALGSARMAEEAGLPHDAILLSAKVSRAPDLWEVYRRLAAACDHPLHLGLTEAGMGSKGAVASTAGLVPLLVQGIGDTIRVSLTPDPGAPREREVQVAQEILASLGIRRFSPSVAACPGCGRTTSTLFQEMARDIDAYLKEQMPLWRERYPGVEHMNVAVMGCVVNGPGESKHADIGISLPGTGETPRAPVYRDGERVAVLQGDGARIATDFNAMVEAYVRERYGRPEPSRA